MSWKHPSFQVLNSDIELTGSVLHHSCIYQCNDIWESTTLLRTENQTSLWWYRKGSAASTPPLAHLIFLQATHQIFHPYITRHYFVIWFDNGILYCPSRSRVLTNKSLLSYMDKNYPKRILWRLWTPSSAILYLIYFALWHKTSPRDSLLLEPPKIFIGKSGPHSARK